MDIVYFLNKLEEVEKLKKILLTEDQLNLFQYIRKPSINLNSSKSRLNSSPKNTDGGYR